MLSDARLRRAALFSEWPWDAPPLVSELARFAGPRPFTAQGAWAAFRKAPPEEPHIMPRTSASSGSIRGRIVSEPMRNKAGRIRYIVCTEEGLLKTISAPQDDADARSLGFFQLARGDLIEAEGLERRGEHHLGLAHETNMRLVMRAPQG